VRYDEHAAPLGPDARIVMNYVNASNLTGRADDGKGIRYRQKLDGKVKG
jgi:hypothetical protein